MNIPFIPRDFASGIYGKHPSIWVGFDAINGAAKNWASRRVGSIYGRIDKTNNLFLGFFTKRKSSGATDDWTQLGGIGTIVETVSRSQFTDGGGTTGTYVLKTQIPLGAYFIQSKILNVTGFIGNVSATLKIGDGSDDDRYNTGTPSVFTTDTSVDAGVPSGTKYHDAAQSVTLTVTGNSDFTLITAGQVTVQLLYV